MFGSVFEDFVTGFQFLTRIPIKLQSEWSLASFGRSVKFFPIIGALIGLLLAGIVYGAQTLWGAKLPLHLLAIVVIVVEIMLTGGLHCDGLMDTVDGIFSGKSRERMLEIMKDSRVGAFRAMSFTLLIVVKYSLIMDIDARLLPLSLLVMPIVGRTAGVVAITIYPYARAEGLGKVFYQCSHTNTLVFAGIVACLLLIPLGIVAIVSAVTSIIFTCIFAEYVSRRLGGLTGDVYGATIELAEVVSLLTFVRWSL